MKIVGKMMKSIEQNTDTDREWEVYDTISDTIIKNGMTNGEVIFFITILLADLVKNDDFDFDELMSSVRQDTLTAIKCMSDA